MSGRIALRDALDSHAERAVERNRALYRGSVSDLTPLTVDVFGYDISLTLDDDFELSQWMALYQQAIGLRTGDLVLLHQEGRDWTLVDVISDTAMPDGLGGTTEAGTGGGGGEGIDGGKPDSIYGGTTRIDGGGV